MKTFSILSPKILLAGFLCIGIFTVSGCKKCRECTARNWDGGVVASEEKCGTNAAIKAFEDDFKIQYLLYDVQCQDK